MDERQWLLGVAYNTGIEYLQYVSHLRSISEMTLAGLNNNRASLLDDAKRWLEAATVVCRFVPDGRARADKVPMNHGLVLLLTLTSLQISDTYARLLARRSHV